MGYPFNHTLSMAIDQSICDIVGKANQLIGSGRVGGRSTPVRYHHTPLLSQIKIGLFISVFPWPEGVATRWSSDSSSIRKDRDQMHLGKRPQGSHDLHST